MNLKKLSDMNKVSKVKTSQNKTLEYKQQGNIAFQLLVQSQQQEEKLDLKELMTYSLTPVPYSLGTADGFLNKTDKSKGFHLLTKDIDDANATPNDQTMVIYDGNAIFHQLREIPPNFGKIADKIFEIISQPSNLIFSTDMYLPESIKSMERERRGSSDKMIIKGLSTKRPSDWKTFLSNDKNKEQLTELLANAWSRDIYAEKIKDKTFVTISKESAYMIKSEGNTVRKSEIEDLQSSQEETDTRVILYCNYAKEQGFKFARVKTPDTDIFFICLHYALSLDGITLLLDTGTGNRRRLIDVSEMARSFEQEFSTALMCLHAFTRCDTTSAFRGIGKVKPLKILQRLSRFRPILAQLGETWKVSTELELGLEEFTCNMYGNQRIKKINDLRLNMIQRKCGSEILKASKNVDLGSLPPCKSCLVQHIRRVNYQVGIWKHAHIKKPHIPAATDGHGWTLNHNKLEPLWTEDDILPVKLVDVLEKVLENTGDSDSDEETNEETEDSDLAYSSDSDSD